MRQFWPAEMVAQISNLLYRRFRIGSASNLSRTATAVLLLCAFGAQTQAAPTPPRPDVLLIMPDQMRGDCLSALNHPAVRTPNLDKLAKEGALFRRAYTTCPSCIPARFSLLTGLYPSTSGVVGFKGKPIQYPTFPKLLADAGYTTVLAGRNMHQVPPGESYGYQKQILGSEYVSDDDYDQFLKKAAPETGGIRELVSKLGLSHNGWEAKPWPLAENLHPTVWVVEQARQALKESPAHKPLFLTASFFSPHPPLFPPKPYFDYYWNKKLPTPAHGDWVNWKALSPKGDKQGHRVLLEGEPLRAAQSGYFGLIEFLDHEIAPLISEFKKRSEQNKRPWLIVFTTDHGEALGDNGFYRKCEPYEGSANIPFIVAGSPDFGFQKKLRSDQLVCLEDVMPTVLDLAGIPCPQPMDGLALANTLRGDKTVIRPWLHFEHADCYTKEQAFHALTDGHLKYIWRPLDGSEQLFDLDKDPHEETDLSKIASRHDALKAWRERLIKKLASRPEGFSDGQHLIAGRPYLPLQR
jgi:arylsulfatase